MQDRPRDLHHLFLCGPQQTDGRSRIDIELQCLQELLGCNVDTSQPVEEMLLAQEKILRDRHRRYKARLLKHHRDAEMQRLKGSFRPRLPAIYQHLSMRQLDHSRHYLGECGLACPVFTDKRMDLTWKQRKIYVLYRGNARVFLCRVS